MQIWTLLVLRQLWHITHKVTHTKVKSVYNINVKLIAYDKI